MSARVEIAAALHPADNQHVRALFTEYAQSLGFSLAYQGFDDELAALPGKYAPPSGALLLARIDGEAVGVVGLRALSPEVCEMKRLYVRPEYRGRKAAEGVSLGRALALALLSEARVRGYRRMRLDTVSGKMDAAMGLYRSLGFVEIPPYYASPIPDTVYLERVL